MLRGRHALGGSSRAIGREELTPAEEAHGLADGEAADEAGKEGKKKKGKAKKKKKVAPEYGGA